MFQEMSMSSCDEDMQTTKRQRISQAGSIRDKKMKRFKKAFDFFRDNLDDVVPCLQDYDFSNAELDDSPFFLKNPVKILKNGELEIFKTSIETQEALKAMTEQEFCIIYVFNATDDLDFDTDDIDNCPLLFVSAADFIDAKRNCDEKREHAEDDAEENAEEDTEDDEDEDQEDDSEDDPHVLFGILEETAKKSKTSYKLKDFKEFKKEIADFLKCKVE
jgi:hypothetical protein